MDITLLFARALKCLRKHPIILERWYVTYPVYFQQFIEAGKKATMKKPDTMEEIQFLKEEFLVQSIS